MIAVRRYLGYISIQDYEKRDFEVSQPLGYLQSQHDNFKVMITTY